MNNQRIIKFRGWDEENKKMLEPQDLSQSREYWPWLGLVDVILMEFTGLMDKNDKEIYEGDIIKSNSQYCEICTVERAGNHFGVGFSCFNIDKEMVDFEDDWSDLEIIGNIYENPELLL